MSLISVGFTLVGLLCFGFFLMVLVVAAMLAVKAAKSVLKSNHVDLSDGIDSKEMDILRDILARQLATKREEAVKEMVKEAVSETK